MGARLLLVLADQRGLGEKPAELDRQVVDVLRVERRRRVAGDLDVLGNVRDEHAAAVGQGLEQDERQALHRRGQHDEVGVRVELLERLAVDVVEHLHARPDPAPELAHVVFRTRGTPADREREAGVEALPGLAQEVDALLRNEPPDEQHVASGFEPVLVDPVRRARLGQLGAVRDRHGVAPELFGEVLAQSLRHDDRPVGKAHRRPLALAKRPLREAPPLLALPVETMHGDHGRPAERARRRGEQGRPQGVEVEHVEVVGQRVRGRQRDVGDRVEVLGVHAGQPHEVDPVVAPAGRRVVAPAVHGDLVAAGDEAAPDLLDVALDPAVERGNPLLPDHGDPHAAAPARRARRAWAWAYTSSMPARWRAGP